MVVVVGAQRTTTTEPSAVVKGKQKMLYGKEISIKEVSNLIFIPSRPHPPTNPHYHWVRRRHIDTNIASRDWSKIINVLFTTL